MTKLVAVLAVVVVVILVVVFVAVRNMRAEDPEEFADRPHGRAGGRGRRDEPGPRYDGREPAGSQAGNGYRSAAVGPDERRGAPPRGGQERRRSGQGGTGESLAPVRARQARGRPPGDSSEWDSSEWEKLSDIDYWTELASDKSLTATAQPAAQDRSAGPAADRHAETAALHSPVPRGTVPVGAPRRDPVTGLPVRDLPQPADRVMADPVLADSGLADAKPADREVADRGVADFATAPAAAAQDRMRPPAEPYAPGFPGPNRGAPPARPPVDPDDDPLTSPSFPRIPASDSRSYHSGRVDTPAAGPRVPGRHLAPTQQLTSYAPPAPQRTAARHASGQHTLPGFDRETDRTNPNGYLPDPRLDGNPYPTSGASAPSAPVPPAPAPPAPIASPSGNPYGSYVTPGSHAAAASYDDYPGMSGNGHGPYLPAAVPPDSGRAANGYWQPTARGYPPGASASGYQGGPARDPGARDVGADAAEYRNGYGRHHQATYLPGGYPAAAGSQDQAGYARQDPYGHNGHGGYPGYGTAGH